MSDIDFFFFYHLGECSRELCQGYGWENHGISLYEMRVYMTRYTRSRIFLALMLIVHVTLFFSMCFTSNFLNQMKLGP
jgi:hypothetical protein